MERATYIIDGYNVIRSILLPAELARGLEAARAALEKRLRAFRAASPGVRLILIYDGSREGGPGTVREEGLEICFARPPRKADDLVVEAARALEGTPGVHVVSSDLGDIGARVSSLRLTLMTSLEFARLVEKRLVRRSSVRIEAKRPPAGESKPERIGSSEVDEWVRRFGFGEEGSEK